MVLPKLAKPVRKKIEQTSKNITKKRLEHSVSKSNVKKEAKSGLKSAKKIERTAKKYADYKPFKG